MENIRSMAMRMPGLKREDRCLRNMEKSREQRSVFQKGESGGADPCGDPAGFYFSFVKGAVGGILTFAVGILLLPFWLIIGLGIGAMALLVGGIAAVVAGAGLLAVMTGTGIMTIELDV